MKPQTSDRKDKADEMARIRKLYGEAQEGAAESHKNYIADLKFSSSNDHWLEEVKQQRGRDRPALTFNRLNGVIKQIIGDYRQNKLAIKVRPAGGDASEDIAEILAGIIRNIESVSNADLAYTNAFECSLRGGLGFFRIIPVYDGDDSFDQDLRIQPVMNPLAVLFDPNARLPTREDAEYCFISDMVAKDEFKRLYPGKDTTPFEGDESSGWRVGESIRVAELFEKERYSVRLGAFSNGIVVEIDSDEQVEALEQLGIQLVKEREAERIRIRWRKISGKEVLADETLPIRYIPVIPVIGEEVDIEGKNHIRSAIYYARDAQHTYNYYKSVAAETLALAPRSPWLLTAAQIEGHEELWDNANNTPSPYLTYNGNTNEPAPQRLNPPPQPAGEISMALGAADDIKVTTGMFDASLGAQGNEMSGTAILARQNQGATATMIFHDNLGCAIEQCGRILIDWIPSVYDTERVVRILDLEGNPKVKTVNQRRYDMLTGITTLLNSITVGKYDVVVTAGPNFASKRLEAAQAMMQMLQAVPQIFGIAGDLIVKNMDWPGADELAARIKRSIPPQITVDPDSPEGQAMRNQPPPVPPAVQMQQAEAQRKNQELQLKHQAKLQEINLAHQAKIEQIKASASLKAEEIAARMQEAEREHASKLAQMRADAELDLTKHAITANADAKQSVLLAALHHHSKQE